LKGKERAYAPPSPSPPRSTITLAETNTETTLSEASFGTGGEGGGEQFSTTILDEEGDGLLYPPENFAIVVPGIFRSSFPRSKNFGFLKSLGLKSVL
jgi:hypothetical protein